MPVERPLRHGTSAGYALIETMRREADGTIPRRERHLGRMANSADALDFAFDHDEAESLLAELPHGALRVRLELSQDGRFALTTSPFVPIGPDTIWRVAIAGTRLDASDPLRRHKTDSRTVYAAARDEFGTDAIDEVLLLNIENELAEGAITNIFLDQGDGVLMTPRLQSGALPGILRAELMDQGKAVEAWLGLDDLRRAKRVFVGNSLRGLIVARLERDA